MFTVDVKQQQHQRQNERKIMKQMRWPGVAQRSDKSDIDVKNLSHHADVASQVEICAILKWFMRKLEIFGSFKFACAILKLLIAF